MATCRATCERLVLARRARRLFYVTDRCATPRAGLLQHLGRLAPTVNGDSQPLQRLLGLSFPLPTGPVVAFKLAVQRDDGGFAPPERGAYLSFTTGSGYPPERRVPYNGGDRDRRRPPGTRAPLRSDRGHRAGDRRHPRLRRLRRTTWCSTSRSGHVGPDSTTIRWRWRPR